MAIENGDCGEYVSKSAKKRQCAALQKLGEELLGMPRDMREKLNLPEELEEALAEGAAIREKEAARRHRQYIGKLMRNVNPVHLVDTLERKAAAGEFSSESSMKAWKKLKTILADLA